MPLAIALSISVSLNNSISNLIFSCALNGLLVALPKQLDDNNENKNIIFLTFKKGQSYCIISLTRKSRWREQKINMEMGVTLQC